MRTPVRHCAHPTTRHDPETLTRESVSHFSPKSTEKQEGIGPRFSTAPFQVTPAPLHTKGLWRLPSAQHLLDFPQPLMPRRTGPPKGRRRAAISRFTLTPELPLPLSSNIEHNVNLKKRLEKIIIIMSIVQALGCFNFSAVPHVDPRQIPPNI